MADSDPTFVIVGASLAGAKAAETLRSEGFGGRIVLVGEEPVRPYERPPLSKDYLRGQKTFDDAAVHPADFYDKQHIELRTATTVVELDAKDHTIVLQGGERLGWERLLMATGATPRRLSTDGADLPGVRYLRTVADCDELRRSLQNGGRVVVIGGGWIGAEVAASARQLGADVAIIELAEVPLERVLGPQVGGVYRDLHADHGVDLHLGVGVEAFHGAGHVEEVILTDGTRLPADLVVVGVGVTPRVELAQSAGLNIDNGITTDEHLATSVPGIFAAGDVANAFHPRYQTRIRLEHWSAALNQGPAAARNMLGKATVYDRTPYFFSDQYDLGMEYRGWATRWDQVIFRGDPNSGEFVAFWLADGRIQAAMNANVWDQGDTLEALVSARVPVDVHQLADPDTPLNDLVPAP